jgi:hypothetical protein
VGNQIPEQREKDGVTEVSFEGKGNQIKEAAQTVDCAGFQTVQVICFVEGV